jgi:hypothetical protein
MPESGKLQTIEKVRIAPSSFWHSACTYQPAAKQKDRETRRRLDLGMKLRSF